MTEKSAMATQKQMPFMPPVAYCNRCNDRKAANGPCPRCGSPEFRLVK